MLRIRKQPLHYIFHCCLTVVLLHFSNIACALNFEVNGFGSFVIGKTISDEQLPNGNQSTYLVVPSLMHKVDGDINEDAYHDNSWSALADSNLALQVTAKTDFDLSATLQLELQGADDFKPQIEWAYLTYAITEELDIKLGRQRLPLYLYSDYLNVAYAYHWLRPPVDVYGEGVTNYDGISVTHQFSTQEVDNELHWYYGSFYNEKAIVWKMKSKYVTGLSLTSTYDWLTVRGSYNLMNNYADVSEDLLTVPSRTITRTNATDATFSSLAFIADFEDYFFVGEVTRMRADPYVEAINIGELPYGAGLISRSDAMDAFMITAGYRFEPFTLHTTYSGRKTSMSVPANPLLRKMHDAVRRSWGLGIRWDIKKDIALKADITLARDKSDSEIQSIKGKSLQNSIFSLGVDFVF